MQETTETVSVSAIQTHIEAAHERLVDKSIRLWHLILAVAAICVTVFGAVNASYRGIEDNIVALQKHDLQVDAEMAAFRKKHESYDSLIQQRNQQYIDTATRLERLETLLKLLVEKKMDFGSKDDPLYQD